jgi:hypothetical protein
VLQPDLLVMGTEHLVRAEPKGASPFQSRFAGASSLGMQVCMCGCGKESGVRWCVLVRARVPQTVHATCSQLRVWLAGWFGHVLCFAQSTKNMNLAVHIHTHKVCNNMHTHTYTSCRSLALSWLWRAPSPTYPCSWSSPILQVMQHHSVPVYNVRLL